jgi:hypothetical protein
MSQRIKGQEVETILVLNGTPQSTITDIKSFEFTFDLDIMSEGYLGETTDRKDAVFKGISGNMELHFENADVFKLFTAIVDKARRRTPGTKINIKATLNFPNGNRPKVMIPDVEFGAIPVSFGSRTDYGSIKLDFQAAEAQVL